MEVSDTVVLGVFGVLLVYYVTHSIKRIELILLDHAEKISEIQMPDLNIESFHEKLEDLVHELLGNMSLPTFGDQLGQLGLHLASQWLGVGPGSIPVVNPDADEDVDILQPPSE